MIRTGWQRETKQYNTIDTVQKYVHIKIQNYNTMPRADRGATSMQHPIMVYQTQPCGATTPTFDYMQRSSEITLLDSSSRTL